MLVGVDGNEANVKNRVGAGRYAYELLRQFAKYQVSRRRHSLWRRTASIKYQVYLKGEPLADLPKETRGWQYKVVGPEKLWTQIGLPLALFLNKPRSDVFFTPGHYAPRFSPCPQVISIMDLAFLHFPKMFKKQDLWQLGNWTAYSVKKAAKILTISQASKNDIIKYYQVPEEKVVVAYPGFNKVSGIKYKVLSMKNVLKKYAIDGDYILSVSTLQPRKNFVRLIEAFSILISQYPNLSLVIAGKPGWLYEEIYAAPKKFGVESKVKFLNYVPDEDLPGLYQKAACFALVSLYEGFGIPVLEAMNFGCPVVVANISSLPEVAGQAGVLVDPYEVKDISRGLAEVLNLSPKARQEMIRKGLAQAKKFSWEKTAQKTLEVIKSVVR